MSWKTREEKQFKTAIGQNHVIRCVKSRIQPSGRSSTVPLIKTSKSLDTIWESRTQQSDCSDEKTNIKATSRLTNINIPWTKAPFTKQESFFDHREASLFQSDEQELLSVESCPPLLCDTDSFSGLPMLDKCETQLSSDFPETEERERGKKSSASYVDVLSDENVNNQEGQVQWQALGKRFEEEKKRAQTTERICLDLLVHNQKLEDENRRLLSYDANLEKRVSEISKKLFIWEHNYCTHQKAVDKLEIELQYIEQDIQLKDQRIGELNKTIEALWITADELADRKVELTLKIGTVQQQLEAAEKQMKEGDKQLTKNGREEKEEKNLDRPSSSFLCISKNCSK
eukprot:gi/632967279/ref/XP_007899890.1/ PREDICTED: girdin-like [Callorhinchus milii]